MGKYMTNLQKIQEFFKRDRFATEQGIVIEEAKPLYAVCSITPQERHKNAGGLVQGGVIFTLADFAFAVAANCGGNMTVSLENSISFISSPRGKITAKAVIYRETEKIVFCDVTVYDEQQNLIAKMNVTGYKKGINLSIL